MSEIESEKTEKTMAQHQMQLVSDETLSVIKAEVEAARDQLDQETARYNHLIQLREKEYAAAKDNHDQRVASAKQHLESLEDQLSGLIMEVGDISLHRDRIVAGDSYELVPDLKVEVVSSGSRYTTTLVSGGGPNIGGALVGDVLAGSVGAIVGGQQKVTSEEVPHDERKLFFTISSSQGGETKACNPDLEQSLRDLAAKVPSCIAAYPSLKESIPPKIAIAREELSQVEEDTSELDNAERAVNAAKEDTTELEKAKSTFSQANQRYKKALELNPTHRKSKARKDRLIAIGLFVLAAFSLILGLTAIIEYRSAADIIFFAVIIFLCVFVGSVHLNEARELRVK